MPEEVDVSKISHVSTKQDLSSTISSIKQDAISRTVSSNEVLEEVDPPKKTNSVKIKNCFSCNFKSEFVCGGCLKAFYCSSNCQRLHWEFKHKYDCDPSQSSNS